MNVFKKTITLTLILILSLLLIPKSAYALENNPGWIIDEESYIGDYHWGLYHEEVMVEEYQHYNVNVALHLGTPYQKYNSTDGLRFGTIKNFEERAVDDEFLNRDTEFATYAGTQEFGEYQFSINSPAN